MILLSFDTEEFDVPREHGVDFPLVMQESVSLWYEQDTGLPEKKRGESYFLLYKQFCRKCAGSDVAH